MEIVLLWCFVLAWMAKRGAEDLVHAVKGTPNPRYELKKAKAAKAGQSVPSQPRYGTRDWFGDLYSDALAAHTEKRRKAAQVKGRPLDDLADAVREPSPRPRPTAPVADEDELDRAVGVMHDDQHPYCLEPCGPTCGRFGWACGSCGTEQTHFLSRSEAEKAHRAHICSPTTDTRPLAPVINLFPDVKLIEKEITMASSEVTGLSTAIAFANHASNAHTEFATTGTEGYVGALERAGNSGLVISSAREAMEASGIAADKWAAHREELEKQQNLKEGYQSNPDAADKEFLLAE